MSASLFRLALILGLMSCAEPLAVDMYLPSMPSVASDLGAHIAAVQGSLAAYLLGYGVAQIVYGPWADQAGRRGPLMAGLSVYLFGAIACAVSPSIGALTVARLLQGLGGAAVSVIPRAMIRDLRTGPSATQMIASVLLVSAISPVLGPFAGTALAARFGWRSIFIALTLAAVFSLVLTWRVVPETLPAERRAKINARALLKESGRLLGDRAFMGPTAIAGFGIASLLVFMASAPFSFKSDYALSATGFSAVYAINAIALMTGVALAAPIGRRLGAARLSLWAIGTFSAIVFFLLSLTLVGQPSLYAVAGGLALGNASLGLAGPTLLMLALDKQGAVAGLASSLGGALQMLLGGVMIGVSGSFFDGTVRSMLEGIALCAIVALTLSQLLLRADPAQQIETHGA